MSPAPDRRPSSFFRIMKKLYFPLLILCAAVYVASICNYISVSRTIPPDSIERTGTDIRFIPSRALSRGRFLPGFFLDNMGRKDVSVGSSKLSVDGVFFTQVASREELKNDATYFHDESGVYFIAVSEVDPRTIQFYPTIRFRSALWVACVILFLFPCIRLLEIDRSFMRETMIFPALFFLILSIPLLHCIVSSEKQRLFYFENRTPAQFPDLSRLPVTEWAEGLSNYFKDNNCYRNFAVGGYLRLHEWELYSPLRFAFRGKDGYLFRTSILEMHATYDADRKASLFRSRAAYFAYSRFAAQRGIPFILTIPPDKETMLNDKLPWWVQEQSERTIMNEIVPLLRAKGVPYFDAREALRDIDPHTAYNKQADPEHWNARGLHHFCRKLGEFLGETINPAYQPAAMEGLYEFHEIIQKNVFGIPDVFVQAELLATENLTAQPYDIPGVPDPDNPLALHMYNGANAAAIVHNAAIPEGRMLFLGDSYTYGSGAPLFPLSEPLDHTNPNRTATSVLPFVYTVRDWLRFPSFALNFTHFRTLCDEFQPDIIILTPCEREIFAPAYTEPQAVFYGEQALGTVRAEFHTAIAAQGEVNGADIAVTIGASKNDPILMHIRQPDASLPLPRITTNAEGYAVVCGIVDSPVECVARLRCTDQRGNAQILEAPVNIGENHLYYQLFGEPNSNYDVVYLPGDAIGTFTVRPFPDFTL